MSSTELSLSGQCEGNRVESERVVRRRGNGGQWRRVVGVRGLGGLGKCSYYPGKAWVTS